MTKPRIWTMFAAFVVALIGVAVLGALAVVARFGPGGADKLASGQLGLAGLTTAIVVTEASLLGTALLFAAPFSRVRLGLVSFRGRPLTWLAIVVGVLASGEVMSAALELAGLFDTGSLGHFRRALAEAGTRGLLWSLLFFGVLAGAAEELFFRGLIQPRLCERWGTWPGIVVTSVLFGLMHFDPVHSSFAFVMGLWMGFVRARTGSVVPPMVAHIVNNLVATAEAAAGLVPGSRFSTVALLVGGLGASVLAVRHVWRALPARAEVAPAAP